MGRNAVDKLLMNQESESELLTILREQNELLKDQIEATKNWRVRFGMGVAQGFGTMIGATVVMSLLIYMLNLATNFDPLKPYASRIVEELETRPGRAVNPPAASP